VPTDDDDPPPPPDPVPDPDPDLADCIRSRSNDPLDVVPGTLTVACCMRDCAIKLLAMCALLTDIFLQPLRVWLQLRVILQVNAQKQYTTRSFLLR